MDNLSLELKGPGIVGILGPNGAGKTSLLKLITGLLFPNSGNLTVNGHSLSERREKALSCIGSQIDETRFHPYLSGEEILRFSAQIMGIRDSEVESAVSDAARITGSGKFLKQKVGTYSSGMKQRFSIANAIVADPEILIFDEPTANLDPTGILEFRRVVLKKKEEGKLVIVSSHLLSEIREMSDRILIMDGGKIVFDSDRESSGRYLSVTLEGKSFRMPKNLAGTSELTESGNKITFRLENGTSNSDVIRELLDMGAKIREVSESEGLERIYGSRTSRE
ncbi:MAG: ABC transporter ATP-binding protein [Candidatus Thermoplasmatota archaeon]|nr:ABC transporter ATP-binding protein [Candidatus Thermoplasmatota archaeon]